MTVKPDEISRLLLERLEGYSFNKDLEETGTVIHIGDGISHVHGLLGCMSGELLEFANGDIGMALNLEEDNVGCVLFSQGRGIREGSKVKRTGRTMNVPVGRQLLGRVLNPLGEPIDGGPAVDTGVMRPIEAPAAGVTKRKPVNTPLQTGLLSIDSMIPIGRGQRQLIIGDRQTGKTSVALDTIINQREAGVICIYVAIGQKASVVANIVDTLHHHKAMENTIIVCSTSADPAPLQYIAPYAACAMAEEFMYNEHADVLIVYDDLSKHAVAYRTMSLLLKRPPGREAYPGDVFYLHSRLLERAARLSDDLGGGSITALPIIETLAGDISAYIPTNVISITDGQIFLESELFFEGFRPAVNVGLSVSRVGGAAQTKAMKHVAGSLRLELAQYRELQIFSQFGSELDAATRRRLDHGKKLMETLKQGLHAPIPIGEQVIILLNVKEHYLENVNNSDVPHYNSGLVAFFKEKAPEILAGIRETGRISDQAETRAKELFAEYAREFKPSSVDKPGDFT
jgi:F-type H+-transporting ATPase subunit alpha